MRELLAENIVFNSPILVKPIDEHTTFLRWVGTMDGHKIESFEIIVDNEQGLIQERTIALRPYPAVKLFRDSMYETLKNKLPPDVWDYPTTP